MKFSIITINFNNRNGLQRTIDSVVSQDCRDYEWIVIDGGSNDGSREIIEQNHSLFSYWVSEPDGGVYDAMNKGIRVAKGEYCLFLNSGDAFARAKVLGEVAKINDGRDIIAGQVTETTGKKIVPPPSLHFRFLYHNNLPHQGEFIKRDLFETLGLYSTDLRILSDYEFNIKAAFRPVSYLKIPMNVSIVEAGGMSMTMSDRICAERKIIFGRLLPKSVLEDYEYWLNPESFSNPVILRLIQRPKMMKVLGFFFRKFAK